MAKRVRTAFEMNGIVVALTDILPLRQIKPSLKASQKFQQILASIEEVGIIEPLVVFPENGNGKGYLLIDGHVRLEALKQLGKKEAPCIVSTDDEGYTYNKRICRLATIQEHAMILNAIRNGVAEEKIARTLNVDVKSIAQRRDLLNGICKEAVDILKNRHFSPNLFAVLKKMKPMRQIEVVELMAATCNFSVPYVKALLTATPAEMLVNPDKRKIAKGLTPEQVAKMEREMDSLQRDLKVIEETHGNAVLNLVLARGYLSKVFENQRVVRYLVQNHGEIFEELQKIVDGASMEA